MTLPEKIAAERHALKLNRSDFAALVGVSQSYISKWESGRQGVSMANAILLSKATGKPVEHFASATRRAPVARPSIDAIAKALTDANHRTVLDLARKVLTRQHQAQARKTRAGGSAPRGVPSTGPSGT